MATKRSRRSLSLAGDGDDQRSSDAAAANAAADANVKKRSRASMAAANAEAAAAAAAAASHAEEQAAMFENLDAEGGYSNWFPRQTGFNTLSKSQINKDIRALTDSAYPAPVESDDDELDADVYMLYDSGPGGHGAPRIGGGGGGGAAGAAAATAAAGAGDAAGGGHVSSTGQPRENRKSVEHRVPNVLQDIWSNELLYYRWRTQKRSLEMHEVIAQRRRAWETYVAVRSTLVEEIRRLGHQRDEQTAVLEELQRTKASVSQQVDVSRLRIAATEAGERAEAAERAAEQQRQLILFLVRQQTHALRALVVEGEAEGGNSEAATATDSAATGQGHGEHAGADDAEPATPWQQQQQQQQQQQPEAHKREVDAGGSGAAERLRAAVRQFLTAACPAPLAALHAELKAAYEAEERGGSGSSGSSGDDDGSGGGGRRTSSRLQQAEAEAARAGGGGAGAGGKGGAGSGGSGGGIVSPGAGGVPIASSVAAQVPRNTELVLSPVADGDEARVLMAAGLSEQQRRAVAEHTDLGRWEADRILLAKAQAAQLQIANDLQLSTDRERKQRRALVQRAEDVAKYARLVAKLRADYAKKKRQWEARELAAQQAHEQRVRGLLARYDPAALASSDAATAAAAAAAPAMTRAQLAAAKQEEEQQQQQQQQLQQQAAKEEAAAGAAATAKALATVRADAAGQLAAQERKWEEVVADLKQQLQAAAAERDAARRREEDRQKQQDQDQEQEQERRLQLEEQEQQEAAEKAAAAAAVDVAAGGGGGNNNDDDDGHNGIAAGAAADGDLAEQLEAEREKSGRLETEVEELRTQLTQFVNENSPRVRPRRNRR